MPKHALFPQKLAINRPASLAISFLDVFDNSIAACSAELSTQR
jgi:hypothetical protein